MLLFLALDIFILFVEYGEEKKENGTNIKKISFDKFSEMMKNRNNDNELESSNKNIYTKLYNDHKSKEKRMQNFIRKRRVGFLIHNIYI